MRLPRSSGVLLHPTALPGAHGIGALGAEARNFVDFLAAAGQHVWQILPLGPTGHGDSPYNALSAFAGNPLLIDLPTLVDWGDLEPADLAGGPVTAEMVDFPAVYSFKEGCLARAAANFFSRHDAGRHAAFATFCAEHAGWLDDYALFSALRSHFKGRSWQRWPQQLRCRDERSLNAWRQRLAPAVATAQYRQFVFFSQWHELKGYANARGIRLFGDLPIFVALDSADVWANQRLFRLDAAGHPTEVAGVPPDYFSATGQLWGNPLYRWEVHQADGFAWWLRRFRAELQRVDLLRIDHFRGFEACWTIPAGASTAVSGRWEPAPGRALFTTLQALAGDLPIVAEDLGMITAEVEELRRDFAFPGMKVLQFAFDSGPDNPYLPHNYPTECVVYTGTHDNPTTRGWWDGLPLARRRQVARYLGKDDPAMPWELIRLAMASVARLSILPCQDLLGLGNQARFNCPGEPVGNWRWRLVAGQLTRELAARFGELTAIYHRQVDPAIATIPLAEQN
jgi:4-alpha-glucanotransferase